MNDSIDPLEEMLSRYRLAGPTAALRQRVLQSPSALGLNMKPGRPIWIFRGAVAATILLALALIVSAERTEQSYLSQIGIGPSQLSEQEDSLSDLLGSDGWARRYMAPGLTAGSLRDCPTNIGDRQ